MDISTTFQTWVNVLSHPGDVTFERERQKPDANLTTALIWMLITGVVTAVSVFFVGRIALAAQGPLWLRMFDQMNAPPEMRAQMQTLLASGVMNVFLGVGAVASVILTPILFLISVGLRHLVARALGGVGAFGPYAYLNATFAAPLTIVGAVVSFVPLLSSCISLITAIYGLVLSYYATKVEQKLSSGRAIVVVLTPLVLMLALVSCFVILVFAVAFSTAR